MKIEERQLVLKTSPDKRAPRLREERADTKKYVQEEFYFRLYGAQVAIQKAQSRFKRQLAEVEDELSADLAGDQEQT